MSEAKRRVFRRTPPQHERALHRDVSSLRPLNWGTGATGHPYLVPRDNGAINMFALRRTLALAFRAVRLRGVTVPDATAMEELIGEATSRPWFPERSTRRAELYRQIDDFLTRLVNLAHASSVTPSVSLRQADPILGAAIELACASLLAIKILDGVHIEEGEPFRHEPGWQAPTTWVRHSTNDRSQLLAQAMARVGAMSAYLDIWDAGILRDALAEWARNYHAKQDGAKGASNTNALRRNRLDQEVERARRDFGRAREKNPTITAAGWAKQKAKNYRSATGKPAAVRTVRRWLLATSE